MKTDPMAFIMGMVGGLFLLISVGITSYTITEFGFENLLISGLILSKALPMFIIGLLILGFGRVLDLLNDMKNNK